MQLHKCPASGLIAFPHVSAAARTTLELRPAARRGEKHLDGTERAITYGGDTMTAIVLVHGGFVDGSGWESVYQILKEDGHSVSIVQNPTLSLAGDVAATKRVLDAQNAPDRSRWPFLWRRGDH